MNAEGVVDGMETINYGTWVPIEKRRILAEHGARVSVCERIESEFRFGQIPTGAR